VAEVKQEERRGDTFGELAERYIVGYAEVKNKPGTLREKKGGIKMDLCSPQGGRAENHLSYQRCQPEKPAKVLEKWRQCAGARRSMLFRPGIGQCDQSTYDKNAELLSGTRLDARSCLSYIGFEHLPQLTQVLRYLPGARINPLDRARKGHAAKGVLRSVRIFIIGASSYSYESPCTTSTRVTLGGHNRWAVGDRACSRQARSSHPRPA
jgi:hypothetical protein